MHGCNLYCLNKFLAKTLNFTMFLNLELSCFRYFSSFINIKSHIPIIIHQYFEQLCRFFSQINCFLLIFYLVFSNIVNFYYRLFKNKKVKVLLLSYIIIFSLFILVSFDPFIFIFLLFFNQNIGQLKSSNFLQIIAK